MSTEPAQPVLNSVSPAYAVPGGKLKLNGRLDARFAHAHRVLFGEAAAHVTYFSATTVSVIVPQTDSSFVRVEVNGLDSAPIPVTVAEPIASDLHPVMNPVFDREGNLYVTFSGSRGQKVPVSVFRIDPDGAVKPYLTEINNPTGMVFDGEGHLIISSRVDGAVYRVSADRQVELVADELGIATGLAFDPEGILYVGDRRGTIFRIEQNGEPRAFCHLPPSVSAFHLAFDREGYLYVTGPSLSPVDSIYRVSPEGETSTFASGFGRPQGMAFDREGNLYVCEALSGSSGLHRLSAEGCHEVLVAAPPLVGLAFDGEGGVVLADTSSVHYLDMGIVGAPLHPG